MLSPFYNTSMLETYGEYSKSWACAVGTRDENLAFVQKNHEKNKEYDEWYTVSYCFVSSCRTHSRCFILFRSNCKTCIYVRYFIIKSKRRHLLWRLHIHLTHINIVTVDSKIIEATAPHPVFFFQNQFFIHKFIYKYKQNENV